jgi:glycosyltransferase involved in cell wall biosynthesis
MKDLVSVVVPNHNGALYVGDTLISVLSQTYPYIEILVVDDGSTDGSLEILSDFGEKINLIRTLNLGASAARNAGIKAARGEFIALLDNDDIWAKNKIQLQVDYLKSSELDLVYCSGQEFGNPNVDKVLHPAVFAGDCYPFFKKFPTRGIIELGCSSAVLRASLINRAGYFDESFLGAAEDWDFFRRCSRFAKVGFCPEILVKYRRHSASITARSILDYYYGNRKAIIKMFVEDSQIRFTERRVIWAKFHFLSAKSFIKRGQLILGAKSLFSMALPMRFKF